MPGIILFGKITPYVSDDTDWKREIKKRSYRRNPIRIIKNYPMNNDDMEAKKKRIRISLAIFFLNCMCFITPFFTLAASWEDTDQIIIKFRSESGNHVSAMQASRMSALSAIAGKTLSYKRIMSGDAHVLRLPSRDTISDVEAIAKRLNADPDVEYAVPDRKARPTAIPNDPLYAVQWDYKDSTIEIGGANLPGAWDITTGAANVVVAIIDTGIRTHLDIATARVLPGYDMISNIATANDGDGRDTNPADPGDWITNTEDATVGGPFEGCGAHDSSWHGTHVAGTIGATTNNGLGIAGINWNSKILPVRVLGKCGGNDSDIIDGIRWAAGISVAGVPNNSNPAKVINMSLGGSGVCDVAYQTAINDAVAAGASVIVAAGNENVNASGSVPANCNGVVTVAAINRAGGRASYSNFGTVVDIAAPGGETDTTNSDGILSTLNTGTQGPLADNFVYYQGTSMATPHVAGIVSLMISARPWLTPAQITSILKTTARTFPIGTGSDCTTSICGVGIVNAAAALRYDIPNPDKSLPNLKAYPNPCYFDKSTLTIKNIPTDAQDVKVYIYTVAGGLVRMLDEDDGVAADNTVVWNGKNKSGLKAASGLYLYLVKTANYGTATGKVYVLW